MHSSTRIILLIMTTVALFCGAMGAVTSGAMAQTEKGKIAPIVVPRPDIATLEAPDWAVSKDQQNSSKADGKFYERCILNTDVTLPGTDRRALCACMDSYQTRIHRENKEEFWTNTIRTRALTPYETFVTRVFGPCMYLEAFTLGARECYSQTRFASSFPNIRAFDDYCTCYANATEDYMRKYAEPLLASRMANLRPDELRYEPDPAQMIMKDTDYVGYIDRERRRCTAIYGYKMNE